MSCEICKKESNKGCKWSPCKLLKWVKKYKYGWPKAK